MKTTHVQQIAIGPQNWWSVMHSDGSIVALFLVKPMADKFSRMYNLGMYETEEVPTGDITTDTEPNGF